MGSFIEQVVCIYSVAGFGREGNGVRVRETFGMRGKVGLSESLLCVRDCKAPQTGLCGHALKVFRFGLNQDWRKSASGSNYLNLRGCIKFEFVWIFFTRFNSLESHYSLQIYFRGM